MVQQSLRAVLAFCKARPMTPPAACTAYSPQRFKDDGEVIDETTAGSLEDGMEDRDHLVRVLAVLPW